MLALYLSLAACNKAAEPTTIVGQVRTYGTEEGIQRAPVRVRIVEEKSNSCFGCGTSYPVKSEVWTDQDGYFSISADLYEDLTYYLAVNDDELLNDRKYIAPTHGSIDHPSRRINSVGGTIHKNYYLTAYGWVRFTFLNQSGSQRFSYSVGGGGYEEFFNPNNSIQRVWDFGGNLEHDIAVGRTLNGVDSVWRESFFVNAFDTIDYQLEY
ncbi:hypothetical protein [Phaeocystidibacter luteus]|uniref:Uncharacterized protein n=1 Tax=Phaeocystidibacter luteus TaxID=911197 RepID=A0A6N6RJM9_9FLAO|nr:hypothetical protein [Phaeocystidibacter luteus]KAB2807672.1 hypothetical protein F8C67_11570 [Phaeocystidibacter luteus]